MDIDGFMTSLAGLERYMTKHIYNWNQLVTRRRIVKGIIEQGKRNLRQNLYHQLDIIE
jgi:hypothetical protein